MPKLKLTAKGVEALHPNGAAQTDYWDALTPGLLLRVGRSGKRVWYVRYRANGKHRRHKLGTYPRLSLADARDEARDVLAGADAGQDPAQDKAEQRTGAVTFRALADEALEARKVRSTHQRRLLLEKDVLPVWGSRPAGSITRRDVVTLLDRVAQRAPIQANRVLAIVRLIFNDGLRRGFPGLESNPAHMVQAPAPENSRDRYLTPKELRAVWKALKPEPDYVRAVVQLVFLTAARVGSVLSMRWTDIDGDIWTIPAESFKGKRPHLVPLSVEARAVLDALCDPAPADDVWVFPSRAGTRTGHVSNFGKPLTRVRTRSKLPHWVMHDARTTFRTWAARGAGDGGLGVLPHVADAVLGHAENTLGYTRYQGDRHLYLLAEKREALAKWGAFVSAAVAREG